MRRILWNIDAIGWFEPIEHQLQYGGPFQWSGKTVIRPNIQNAIDSLIKIGFEVYAVSSKNESYLQECVKAAGIELKVKLGADLPEKNLLTDYSSLLEMTDQHTLIIGNRPGNQPMNSGAVFVYDYKPSKKDAMIDYLVAKKLFEVGNDNVMLGYNKIFFSNISKDSILIRDEVFIDGVDFYGLKLEMGIRKEGCHSIPTIIIDESVSLK